MSKSYTFFGDPGHSWLRVQLKELELIKDKISACSYMRGKYAYLEEDCDAILFLNHRFGEKTDYKKMIKEKHSNSVSKIRSFEHYHVRTEQEKTLMNSVIGSLLKRNFTEFVKDKIKNASFED
jgi:DNA recombination-dependent growth factor C